MGEVERRPCSRCGAPLAIVVGPNGKRIPLDERAQTYRIGSDLTGNPVAELAPGAMVTHFATCPKANEFSSSRRRR